MTGYIYSTGTSAWGVGVSMALAGVTGIASTFIFTRLRRRIGLERTGLIAFNLEILCLTLAVASVWAPGSPFDVHFASRHENCSQLMAHNGSSTGLQAGFIHLDMNNQPQAPKMNESGPGQRMQRGLADGGWERRVRRENWDEGMAKEPQYSMVHSGSGEVTGNNKAKCKQPYRGPNISIILFLIGIITSRTGETGATTQESYKELGYNIWVKHSNYVNRQRGLQKSISTGSSSGL